MPLLRKRTTISSDHALLAKSVDLNLSGPCCAGGGEDWRGMGDDVLRRWSRLRNQIPDVVGCRLIHVRSICQYVSIKKRVQCRRTCTPTNDPSFIITYSSLTCEIGWACRANPVQPRAASPATANSGQASHPFTTTCEAVHPSMVNE